MQLAFCCPCDAVKVSSPEADERKTNMIWSCQGCVHLLLFVVICAVCCGLHDYLRILAVQLLSSETRSNFMKLSTYIYYIYPSPCRSKCALWICCPLGQAFSQLAANDGDEETCSSQFGPKAGRNRTWFASAGLLQFFVWARSCFACGAVNNGRK